MDQNQGVPAAPAPAIVNQNFVALTQEQLQHLLAGLLAAVPPPAGPQAPAPPIPVPANAAPLFKIAAPRPFAAAKDYSIYEFLDACEWNVQHYHINNDNHWDRICFTCSYLEGIPEIWA